MTASNDPLAEEAKKVRDAILEMQTAAYGHAQTYTTVVVFGAYAALFTVWSFTKDKVDEFTSSWVGLLMAVSVLTFVLYEIFMMVLRSFDAFGVRRLLLDNLSPAEFLKARDDLKKRGNMLVMKIGVPVWIFALIVTITTGTAATALLICAFLRQILS